jgi:hypothetical protein
LLVLLVLVLLLVLLVLVLLVLLVLLLLLLLLLVLLLLLLLRQQQQRGPLAGCPLATSVWPRCCRTCPPWPLRVARAWRWPSTAARCTAQ